MKELTPQERFVLYCVALSDYEGRRTSCYPGFCPYFLDMFQYSMMICMYELLPELYEQKPEDKGWLNLWFPSYEVKPRIACLENALNLLTTTYGEELFK